jgi:nitrite reductase/ring-hydroxylating ferredoxin subunit
VEVARVQDVPPGTVIVVEVGGRQLAVAKWRAAFRRRQPVLASRRVARGRIDQRSEWALECLLHGSVFDVRTGEVLNPPAAEASAPTPWRWTGRRESRRMNRTVC